MEDDDNDLTERYKQLEGKTLGEVHDDEPDPNTSYGEPDPRVVLEMVGEIAWLWSWANADANIQYEGELKEIKE